METETGEQFILVLCPICHTRMHARREHVGRRVACPDCGTETTIPLPPPVAPKPKRADPGEYHLRDDATQSTAASPSAQPRLVLVKCTLCGTRMHARAEHAGRKLRCPDCSTLNTIPEYHEVIVANPAPDLVVGKYDVGEVAPRPTVAPTVISHEPVTANELPPPPRQPLFSGIYSFPWREGVLVRWIYITAGLILIFQLLALARFVSEGDGDLRGSVLAVGSILLVTFFIAVWTFSFAASCASTVIQETAEGADAIADWPSPDWREWFFPLLYVMFVAGLSVGAGWGVRTLARLAGAEPLVVGLSFVGTVFISFPIIWLSALESGSLLSPFSAPVLSSLFRLFWAWLLFYLQTGFWLAVLVALVGALVHFGWNWGIGPIVAPLLAAYWFVYPRLLGRLGWLIVDRLGTAE